MTDDSNDNTDNDDSSTKQKYSVEAGAGSLRVSADGETPDEAKENFEDVWDKVVGDLTDMDQEERNQIHLM